MAGLYIHIPFCASRCIYCGFYSTTHLDLRQQYIDAVCHEMELHNVLGDVTEPISTMYIGGGTPSQLTAANSSNSLFILIRCTATKQKKSPSRRTLMTSLQTLQQRCHGSVSIASPWVHRPSTMHDCAFCIVATLLHKFPSPCKGFATPASTISVSI